MARSKAQPVTRKHSHNIVLDPWCESKCQEAIANTTGLNRSLLVRKALRRFFKEEATALPIIVSRSDRILAKMEYLIKLVHIHLNVSMHSRLYDFLVWPDFNPEERQEATTKARALIVKYETSLRKKIIDGGYLKNLHLEDMQDLMRDSFDEIAAELRLAEEEQTAAAAEDTEPRRHARRAK